MELNINVIGYWFVFSLLLSLVAYFLLKPTREFPFRDSVIILLLSVIPPLSLLALVCFYMIPMNKHE